MSAIVLLDTSIYLNVLDVPGFSQHRGDVLVEFRSAIDAGDHFLLPLATVWETGNHVARLDNGGQRRKYAEAFVKDVSQAFNGKAPYRATHFPDRDEFLNWLADFPSYVVRSKSANKRREGVSLADLSLVKEWERTCALHPMSRVRIWSRDGDLAAYDRRA